jgi:hypothetical protein
MLAERLMQDDAESIVNAVITAARNGDMTAARIILDRIAPARRDRPIQINIGEVKSASDSLHALGSIITAMAAGDISPEEAAGLAAPIEKLMRAIELVDLEARIVALEAAQHGN